MLKKFIGVSSLVMTLAIGVPMLAQAVTMNPGTPNTTATDKAAAKAALTATQITCVGTAVAARESTLDTAIATETKAISDAYTARASALATAYSLTTATDVKAGVKTAWSDFKTSVKTARTSWQKSRQDAWKAFKTARTACKAPASISDSGNAGSEVSGN